MTKDLLPTLAQRFKNISRRMFPGTVILCYHRVADIPSDPYEIAIPPAVFEQHCQVMRSIGQPLPLMRVTGLLRGGKTAALKGLRRGVVITFDDGYADNLQSALPALQRHDLPATIFVASGYTGTKTEFWWDELERLLLEPGKFPVTASIQIGNQTVELDFGPSADYTDPESGLHRNWKFGPGVDPTAQHTLLRKLHPLLGQVSEEVRNGALDQLRVLANSSTASPRPAYFPMSETQIVQMARCDLIEIGAHTVSHSMLPPLPSDLQRREIANSRSQIARVIGREPTSFAYPFGWHSDETVSIVREAGFACACSTIPVAARSNSDLYRIPRLMVGNWSAEELQRRLEATFGTG